MQEFTVFDMIVIGITLVLGLKGLFKGFIKEVFGIIGIIGGIFIASRVSLEIGTLIAPILALENEATIKLLGFIIALIGFWVVVYFLGLIIDKIMDLSGLGIVNRIFGFVFGSAKIFLIFSVITYAIYQVNSFRTLLDEKIGTSVVFPYLLDTGSYIIKLDTTEVAKTVEKSVDNVVNSTKETFNKEVEESIKNEVEKKASEIKEKALEHKKQIEEKISEEKNKALETNEINNETTNEKGL